MTETLTGKIRFRVLNRWFRQPVLVAQVEIHRKGIAVDHSEMGFDKQIDTTYWRDAMVEDLGGIE